MQVGEARGEAIPQWMARREVDDALRYCVLWIAVHRDSSVSRIYRTLMVFRRMFSKNDLIWGAVCVSYWVYSLTIRILTWLTPGALTFWAMRSMSDADGYGSRSYSAWSAAKTCGGDGEA